MKITRRILLVGLAMVAGGFSPAHAQTQTANPPLGLVVRALKAHVGNTTLMDGSTLYSGDFLSTEDGGAVLVRMGSLSLELQGSSAAHVFRTPYGAIAELDRGTAIYTTPGGRENLVIVASDVRVTPVLAVADFGRVTIDDPCNVSVYSQKGQADVQVGSESHFVEEGRAYRVRAENAINYREYVSPEDSDYHNYHAHKPCAPVQMVKGHAPIAPGQSRFLLVASIVVGAATIIAVSEALESPSRP
jgi:hypothetical protein